MKELVASKIIRSPWREREPEHERLARMLTPPFAPNHMPRHPALGPTIAEEIKKLAPVYRLDLHCLEAIEQICKSSRRMEHAFEHCHAPHPSMFYEFPELIGFMSEGDRDDCLISMFMGDRLYRQIRCNFDEPLAAKVTEFGFGGPPIRNIHVAAVWHTAAVWMFLTINGATTVDHKMTREGRLARHRGKSFALGAIDSYNQVQLVVPASGKQRAVVQFKRGPGVRFHDVQGHWRETDSEGGMMLRWIAAYWRGNAALGTVVKVRNVKARRKHNLPPPDGEQK